MGRDLERLRPALESRLRGAYELSFHSTKAPGDATRLTRARLDEGVSLIAGVGGDGTFHEVVNGYFENGTLVKDVPLAFLTRGTGGDTRRTLGLPIEIGAFADMLLAGNTRRIDIGLAEFTDHEGKPIAQTFVNIGDLGIGGDVVTRVNRSSKRMGGFVSFLWSTLLALVTYRAKEVEVVIDDGPPERHALLILAVANCRYFGGGMHIAPTAEPTDGLLDIIMVRHTSKARLFANLHRIYTGTHLGLPEVIHRRARTIRATSVEGEIMVDLDGEQPGKLPVTFRVLPAALAVCVP